MGKKARLFLAALAAAVLVLTSCGGPGEEPSGGKVHFLVTRDFGHQEIFNSQILVSPGESALEALQGQLEVETEYGGRFVAAIQGLTSKTGGRVRHDWFFYTNGITAAVGGGDYYPREGDVIWWDYHAWSDHFFTPAVTGAFPQPFLGGYRGNTPGTLILFTPSGRTAAERIAETLSRAGVLNARLEPYGAYNLAQPREILITVGLWPELAREPFWQGMQENRQKIGWFARLGETRFYACGLSPGEEKAYGPSVGAVLVSGSGLGDPYPLWLVTGLDEESLNRAAALLAEDREQVRGTFGFLATPEELIRLPLQTR